MRSQVPTALPAHQLPAFQLPPKAPNMSEASKESSNLQARDCSPSSSRPTSAGSLPTPTQPTPTELLRSPSPFSAPSSWAPSSRGLSSPSSLSSVGPAAPYRPYPYQSLPAMGGSVLSNIHQPGGHMLMIPGMDVPRYGHHLMMHGLGLPPPQSRRPFKCDQCVQSFSRNHDLKRHKRIHLAVKPFPCTFCGKSFSRKDAIKRHRLVKGCGATSEKREEGSELDKNVTDILTRDCKPGLKMCTDNQPPQLGSITSSSNNSPFPTTSREDEPSSQDDIQLTRAIIKMKPLEDALETFTKHPPPNYSQQHTLPMLPKLSEDPEYRVSSQTPHSDGSSAVTERYIDERKSQIVDSIVFNVTQWLRSNFDACRKHAGFNASAASGTSEVHWGSHSKTKPSNSIKPNNGKRKSTERDDCETDDDDEDRHREDGQSNDRSIQGNEKPKYACPYFKYNPAKYKDWRICPGPGWTDVHRVKGVKGHHSVPCVSLICSQGASLPSPQTAKTSLWTLLAAF